MFDSVGAASMSPLVTKYGFMQLHQPGQLKELLAQNWDGEFRVMYTPVDGEGVQHFEAVNRMVRDCGRMIYAIDEVDKYQQPGYAPPGLYDLINYGRHSEVAMIGTARRPAQVSKEYTYGLSEVVAFQFTEPGDLKYFEQKCGEDAAGALPRLGQYEYLRWMQDRRMTIGKGWK